ncbi:MAG: T9SS type A sorting domain-containing protein [Bacteroidota bacterium]|nr:T9SS type A sorting domain-containing protein [Bacteroidota bacterium]
MKINKLLFSTLIISFMLLFFFFKPEGKKQNIRVYPSDNPAERVVWERLRLADPNTGEIPRNMHRKERMFAKTLPQANTLIKANWVHRGPYNVGGRTRGFALDILDEKTLFAGGASGGMFRSIDAGLSWDMTTHPNQLHNVTCVAQDTRVGKEHIWYFGSGELRGSSASGGEAYYQGNGIYKSTDGGLSWDSLSITATNTPQSFDSDFDFIWNLKTDPSNDSLDVLYAATYGTIYRSQDGGNTWQQELGGGSSYYTNVDITSNGTVYATLSTGSSSATDKGIWRSSDGQNWTNILDTAFPLIYGRIAIGINPSNENEVYFLAAETDGYGQHTDVFFGGETWTSLWKYTYLSGDGSGLGGQWTDLSLNIPANQNTSFDNFNAQGGYDLLVKVHPSNPDVVFIGGTNLWRSTDGFTSPNNTMICGGYLIGSYEGDGNWGIYPNHHPDQHDLWFLPSNDSVMLSATDGGVYTSSNAFEDTVKWVSLNNGYYTSQLYAATISRNANSNVLHGGFQDNGNFITFSGNPNKHWHMPFNGDGAYAGIADNEEDFYLSIQRGVMYKMKLDTNAHRISFNRMDPVSTDSTKYLFINPLVMDENSDIIYLANGNNLWRNNNISNIPYNNSHVKSDFGWERFTDSLPNPLMRISVIETSVNPPNIVYYGTKNKYVYRVDNAHIGDPPHTQLSGILTGQNSYCSDIAINPLDADEVMVVYSNYSVYSLFHSMDGGVTWSKVAGNLEQNNSGSGNGPSCRTAKIIPLGNDTLYLVGTSVGLFGTSELDGLNTTWKQIAKSEIGNVVIETLTYRAADKLLVVATHGNGIYSINLNNVGSVLSVEDDLHKDQSDIKIYPNPTQGNFKLDFTIDNPMDISWVVYSETGRIVQSKKVKKAISGNNQISVSLNGLSSGMYYITLNIGENKITRQIIKQ